MLITTERLELREYVSDDLDSLIAYQSDPRVQEFYGPGEGSPEQLSQLLRTFQSWAIEEPRRNWQLAIVLRERPGVVVGSCGIRQSDEPGEGDFGIDLSAALWRRGYATEAARAMLDFAFAELGLEIVRGETVSANARVAALLTRLGFRHAGSEPGAAWMEERGWTLVHWELSREAWHDRPASPV